MKEYPDCTPNRRHFFPVGTDHCTCGALRRPPVDVAEACLFTPATDTPPEEGDIQRRCWTLYMHPDGNGQCVLFNGHDGEHRWQALA